MRRAAVYAGSLAVIVVGVWAAAVAAWCRGFDPDLFWE